MLLPLSRHPTEEECRAIVTMARVEVNICPVGSHYSRFVAGIDIISILLGTNMARKPRSGIIRRVQLRIDSSEIEIFDRYTDTERSEIFNRALKTIYPKIVGSSGQAVLIRPRQIMTETICRIVVDRRVTRLIFPEKREDFRAVVKKFCYSWQQRYWERRFGSTVDILDRAAEIGHELLLVGFCISVDIETVIERIVSMKFEPEAFKLINAAKEDGAYAGWLTFNYPKGEEWYEKIIKITATKYADGKIYVPPEHYLEVEDFAEVNDFVFTDEAISIVDRAKAVRAAAIEIVPRRSQIKKLKSKKQHEPGNSIPDHLRDD